MDKVLMCLWCGDEVHMTWLSSVGARSAWWHVKVLQRLLQRMRAHRDVYSTLVDNSRILLSRPFTWYIQKLILCKFTKSSLNDSGSVLFKLDFPNSPLSSDITGCDSLTTNERQMIEKKNSMYYIYTLGNYNTCKKTSPTLRALYICSLKCLHSIHNVPPFIPFWSQPKLSIYIEGKPCEDKRRFGCKAREGIKQQAWVEAWCDSTKIGRASTWLDLVARLTWSTYKLSKVAKRTLTHKWS